MSDASCVGLVESARQFCLSGWFSIRELKRKRPYEKMLLFLVFNLNTKSRISIGILKVCTTQHYKLQFGAYLPSLLQSKYNDGGSVHRGCGKSKVCSGRVPGVSGFMLLINYNKKTFQQKVLVH